MLRCLLALSLLVTTLTVTEAQQIEIQEFRQDTNGSGSVLLRLSVTAKNDSRERYIVKLFSSFNGGDFQRLSVSRNDVAPGEPVTFNLSPSDLGGVGSKLQLRVEIEATVFPLVVSGDTKVKKGKELYVAWQGYNAKGPYKVELIDDLNRAINIGEENGNSIRKTLDKDMDKGNYKVRVTPAGNQEAFGEMDVKIAGGSALLIIAPVALGGGAAAYFLLGGEPTPDGPGGGDSGLPNPPADPDTQ